MTIDLNDLKTKLLKIEGNGGFDGDSYNVTSWHRNPDGPAAVAEIERLEAHEAKLAQALKNINHVASPNGERTFDKAIYDIDWIASEARLALSG